MSPGKGRGARRIADRPPPILTGEEGDDEVLRVALAYYRRCAKDCPDLVAWLHRIAPDTAVAQQAVRLGYGDRTLGLHLPEANRKAGAAVRGTLKQQGIYRHNGREHFRGCVTIVICDEGGRVTGILGYRVGGMHKDVMPALSSTGTIPEQYAHRTLGDVLRDMQGAQIPSVAQDELPAPGDATDMLDEAIEIPDDIAGGGDAPDDVPVGIPVVSDMPVGLGSTVDTVGTIAEVAPLPEPPDAVMLARAVAHYEGTAMRTAHVRKYLDERGVGSPRMLEHLHVGFCDRSFSGMLPPRGSDRGAQMRDQLSRVGLLDERGNEHFHGCLTVALTDEKGAVVQMVGHRIGDAADAPRRRYLADGPRGVFMREALGTEVVVVQSLMDLLTWWAHGFRHATLLPAPDGLGEDLVAALQAAGTERLLLAISNEQGELRETVDELRDEVVAAGMCAFKVDIPAGLDLTSYAREQGPRAKDALSEVLRGAHWLGGTLPAQKQGQRPVAPLATDDPVEQRQKPAAGPAEEATDRHVTFTFGDTRWRVGGLKKNLGHNSMNVSVFVTRPTPDGHDRVFPDAADLQQARARETLEKKAAIELGLEFDVVHRQVGTILLRLDTMREEHIQQKLQPKAAEVTMTDAEREQALSLLQQPDLIEHIAADLERCGVVGEGVNKRVAYLAAVSRKLDRPLAIMAQSSSGAGKSSVIDSALSFVPDEDKVSFSALTAQALYYVGNQDLKHKVLSIAEEAGAKTATYSIKVFQSDGKLSIASTGKDADTGRVVAVPYEVEGPASIFMTTTALDVDEELLNRCIVLTVDESREQTRAIHAHQRRAQSLEGKMQARDRDKLVALHQNAQRLLEPLMVVNPFAEQLQFSDAQTRARRDQPKYLTLINAIALLHQHQRDIKTERVAGETVRYIEVTRDDIAMANKLAHAVLGRSLDEVPPQTRKVLTAMHELLTVESRQQGIALSEFRCTRRWLRDRLPWQDTQLKNHLRKLVDLEYVLVHRGRERREWQYELAYDGKGQDGTPFVAGLIDPDEAQDCDYDADAAQSTGERSGTGRGSVGPRSGSGRTG